MLINRGAIVELYNGISYIAKHLDISLPVSVGYALLKNATLIKDIFDDAEAQREAIQNNYKPITTQEAYDEMNGRIKDLYDQEEEIELDIIDGQLIADLALPLMIIKSLTPILKNLG